MAREKITPISGNEEGAENPALKEKAEETKKRGAKPGQERNTGKPIIEKLEKAKKGFEQFEDVRVPFETAAKAILEMFKAIKAHKKDKAKVLTVKQILFRYKPEEIVAMKNAFAEAEAEAGNKME